MFRMFARPLFTLPFLLVLCVSLRAVAEGNLAAYGVVGDGLTDDTAAIQTAVDSGLGGLHFPRGTYRITQPIVVDLDKVGWTAFVGDGVARILMTGAGPAIHLIGTHAGTADPPNVQPNVWEQQRAPLIDGLEIVGGHPAADGIEATGTMQLTITRTTIREVRHGIHLTVRNRNVIISNCHLYHNRGVGVFLDAVNLHQTNIVGCHISYNAGGGVVSRGGDVRNLQIGTCDIESNMTAETPPTANVLIDCTDGSTAEVAIVGCTLQHNCNAPDSVNVWFIGPEAEPTVIPDQEPKRWGHLTIADNVLTDVLVNVRIQHARNVTLTGNSFGVGREHDLLVEDSSKVVVANNVFDRNPPYFTGTNAENKGGLSFRRAEDCLLTGNLIHGVRGQPAAVLLEQCRDFNVANNTILDCAGAGLLLRDLRESLVTGCLIRDRRADRAAAPSMLIEGGADNEIGNNKLSHGMEFIASPVAN